jgi:predicted N-formylglutamate amidohydrolase
MIEGPHDGENFTIIPGVIPIPIILSCEHASNVIPPEYKSLGLGPGILNDHWGWDLGAWATVLRVASKIRATAVGSLYSRLLIDLNRSRRNSTLIVDSIQGEEISGNQNLCQLELESRIQRYYMPYHDALTRVCQSYQKHHGKAFAFISIHSFTANLGVQDRDFDLGVLFDDRHSGVGHSLVALLNKHGLRSRANEPYSGMRGEIFAAARRGAEFGMIYFELEINQDQIKDDKQRQRVGHLLARLLPDFVDQQISKRA